MSDVGANIFADWGVQLWYKTGIEFVSYGLFGGSQSESPKSAIHLCGIY